VFSTAADWAGFSPYIRANFTVFGGAYRGIYITIYYLWRLS
jgi:hypothetical protein